MSDGEYIAVRAPRNESENIYLRGELHRGQAKVSVDLVVRASSPDKLVEGLRREMAEGREVDPDECHGLQGFDENYEAKYPNWGYDERLGPAVAVIWHPVTIVPPATVLDERAVIYGALTGE